MSKVELRQLIETGAHFGHLTRRWNPKMKPYIFMEKNGIHIIDLKKTQASIEKSANSLRALVSQGKRVLFVGTKKQAKNVIAEQAKRCEMNWVSERWLGGMLTNFATIRKSVKRMQNIEKMESDGTFEKITKKERLMLTRERDKLRKVLNGIETLNHLPGAMFVVDIKKESIAVKEAHRLNIPVFAIVDTNCDPEEVDYMIPANDDAVRAIELIAGTMADTVLEGLVKARELKAEEAAQRERERKEKDETSEPNKEKRHRVRRVKFDQKGEKKSERTGKKKTETAKPEEVKEEKPAEKTEKKPVEQKAETPEVKTEAKVEEKTEAPKEAVEEKKVEAEKTKEADSSDEKKDKE
ncbi:MAG: 30S ribosomal protein S2 [Chlorobi bacterium]|nr:30S ribosomal protein S2 [Chlorobiota bacterium]